MVKVGLREVNQHFSRYLRLARAGEEVVVTERGTPVAIIKPLPRDESPEAWIVQLEEHGVLIKASAGRRPLPKPVLLTGKPLFEAVIEGREDRV